MSKEAANEASIQEETFSDRDELLGSSFQLSSFDRNSQRNSERLIDGSEDESTTAFLRENRSKSNIFMAFMNMANSILGAGVIGQPFAIKNCGLVGGIFAVILLSVLVDWTIRLIVVNMKITGKTTYQDSVEFAMGRKGKLLILLSNGLFAFGGCVGFCIIIGDTIPHVLRAFFPGHENLFHRNIIIILVTCFISFPLSLNRNISKLSKASMLALVSMVFIVVIVLVEGPMIDDAYKGSFNTTCLLYTSRCV